VLCGVCKQPLKLFTPETSTEQKASKLQEQTGVRCSKGCTDILLDFI